MTPIPAECGLLCSPTDVLHGPPSFNPMPVPLVYLSTGWTRREKYYRKIIHIDMDAFYASVEQRDNPEYRGKAIVVGDARGRSRIGDPDI